VTLDQPVDFGHRTNDPVRLVVGLAAPDEESHVTALSTLAEFLADEDSRAGLIGAAGPDDVLRLVGAFERRQEGDAQLPTTDLEDAEEPT
jgi:PTS system ascorbate-specific IIA component